MYAQRTKVPVHNTRGEIEKLLRRHGADGFLVGSANGQAMIAFEMKGWRLKFLLPLPVAKRADQERRAAQEERRRWRALLLVLKAKLEAVESGIVMFEREFLPFIVTDGAQTVADQVLPGLSGLIASGKMPPLLGPGSGDA